MSYMYLSKILSPGKLDEQTQFTPRTITSVHKIATPLRLQNTQTTISAELPEN